MQYGIVQGALEMSELERCYSIPELTLTYGFGCSDIEVRNLVITGVYALAFVEKVEAVQGLTPKDRNKEYLVVRLGKASTPSTDLVTYFGLRSRDILDTAQAVIENLVRARNLHSEHPSAGNQVGLKLASDGGNVPELGAAAPSGLPTLLHK